MTAVARPTFRRPTLYPKQFAAIYAPHRYAVIEASTKSGKTAGCLAWLAEQAFKGRRGRAYWWVAPTYTQARMAFNRQRRALPHDTYLANESQLTLTYLHNGAAQWFKSADNPDSLYGEDVYAVVIDEATRCKEEAWLAVRSTITATRGPVRIIGNVKGRKNWAYQLARRAEQGDPEMAHFKLTAYDAVEAGVLAADEIASAKAVLPEAVFRELYLAEPSEDGGNPFGGDRAIGACIAPLSSRPVVAWGWDLAKHVDYTVGIGLDAEGRVAALERFQQPWDQTEAVILRATGTAPALVDSTGVGDPILERLQKGRGNFEGYKFTAPSKQQLMEGLAMAIQRQAVRYPDGPIVRELTSFEYEYTRTGVRYAAPEGLHDDCVMALALAVHRLAHRPARLLVA